MIQIWYLEISEFRLHFMKSGWNQGEAYEACTVDHSFVGKDSSYVYATRPSGQGHFLLMTPETETGAGFEYQDHWQVGQRRAEEKEWCMDQADGQTV